MLRTREPAGKGMTVMQPKKTRADLWMDRGLVTFLVIFDVATRLMPHPPGVTAVAASALFAGRTLRIPALAVVVPLLAMALSGAALASDDGRISLVVYAAITVPAFAAALARRGPGRGRDDFLLADLFRGLEFRGLGLQRHVSA